MQTVLYEATNAPSNGSVVQEMRPLSSPTTEIKINLRNPRLEKDITFESIAFTASLGFRKGTKQILHQINGRFPPGQLIAIMGPSGAGKSTLLDVLSGYRITGIKGTVYVNGLERDLNAFRRASCYITQDDRLQSLLTVMENMMVVADLKLGNTITIAQKEAKILNILNTLGLEKARDTKAGGLSGGQKKRLSIALELIDDPSVMFLDEPTTGLDSSSCSQCIKLLQQIAHEGKTIICTIHQPSASLFQLFDLVYVLSAGKCLYQGSTENLVPFLENIHLPCPQYHNPADYVIELACGEHGFDKIDIMVEAMGNGQNHQWYTQHLPSLRKLRDTNLSIQEKTSAHKSLQNTSQLHQLGVLLRRGFLKAKRDNTLTWMRIGVNIIVGIMLGTLYWQSGSHGGKVLDNYSLLFSILMHLMMSTMMLTILTFPSEMSILIKEHFNRWYSLKMYYVSITIVDIPISIVCSVLFLSTVYVMTGQPLELNRFLMFFIISMLVAFVAQGFGLCIGAVFSVVNGTFIGPCLSVPMMMFCGFGVSLRDLPTYLYWGSFISYLRYGLEGVVGAIYGMDRPTIYCPDEEYCHYKYPAKFLKEISMRGDQCFNDIVALIIILFTLRTAAFILLRWKINALR